MLMGESYDVGQDCRKTGIFLNEKNNKKPLTNDKKKKFKNFSLPFIICTFHKNKIVSDGYKKIYKRTYPHFLVNRPTLTCVLT